MSHDIDPKGDVVLLLFDPNPNFAVWDESLKQRKKPKKDKKNRKFVRSVPEPDELDQSIENVAGLVIQENIPEYAEAPQSLQILDLASVGQSSTSMQTFTAQKAEEPELRLRVSSRHLMLASTYFNRMFSNNWEEVTSCTIKAEGWDPETFLVLMNIIHGRTRQVPRAVSLESLAKLAVLVDYYDCLEVVEIYSEKWIENLKNELRETYGRDLVLWTIVSWVFQQPDLFRRVTAVALKHIQGRLPTLGLPIPQRVIGLS